MIADERREGYARLAAELRRTEGRVPYDEVDWDALASRITARAKPILERGAPQPLWAHAARWSRTLVPLAVAASIAAIAIGSVGSVDGTVPVDSTIVGSSVAPSALSALTGVSTEQELAGGVMGTNESFVAEVLGQ